MDNVVVDDGPGGARGRKNAQRGLCACVCRNSWLNYKGRRSLSMLMYRGVCDDPIRNVEPHYHYTKRYQMLYGVYLRGNIFLYAMIEFLSLPKLLEK